MNKPTITHTIVHVNGLILTFCGEPDPAKIRDWMKPFTTGWDSAGYAYMESLTPQYCGPDAVEYFTWVKEKVYIGVHITSEDAVQEAVAHIRNYPEYWVTVSLIQVNLTDNMNADLMTEIRRTVHKEGKWM